MHPGDVVDQAYVLEEWPVADEAMRVLEDAGLGYSILPGNHDLNDGTGAAYNRWFTDERAAGDATFGARYTDGSGVLVQQNDHGHDVVNALQDYQMAYQVGNSLLGLLQFDLTNNTLTMTALSPWVAVKPRETLNQFDELILEDPADSWSVPLHSADRFAGFAPD